MGVERMEVRVGAWQKGVASLLLVSAQLRSIDSRLRFRLQNCRHITRQFSSHRPLFTLDKTCVFTLSNFSWAKKRVEEL